jgi:hypothetical protein
MLLLFPSLITEDRAAKPGKSICDLFEFHSFDTAKKSNARHHPPPRAIDVHEIPRVGGRVHAVVRCVFAGRKPLRLDF